MQISNRFRIIDGRLINREDSKMSDLNEKKRKWIGLITFLPSL